MGCCFSVGDEDRSDQKGRLQEKTNTSFDLPESRRQVMDANLKIEADALKEKGNMCFRDGKYPQALKFYNSCIQDKTKYPLDPVYFTNQAMCLRRMSRWDQALDSANKALKLDPTHLKAKIHKAVCLAELSKTKPTSKSKKYTLNQSEEILESIKGEAVFAAQVQVLLEKATLLRQVYLCDEEKQIQLEFQQFLLSRIPQNPITAALKPHYAKHKDITEQINIFLKKQVELEECPQYFQDPISYELFKTPFLCPSGITYQKQLLLDHMKVHGARDPTTKQDFTQKQPVVNKQLMSMVEASFNVTKWRKMQKRPINSQFINF